MIDFRCVNCGKLLRTPVEAAGKQAQCPSCNTVQPVPVASDPALGASPFQSGLPPATETGANPFQSGSAPAAAANANPYAGSAYSIDMAPSGQWIAPGQVSTALDLGDILRRSWTIFRARMGACLAVMMLFIVVMLMCYAIAVAVVVAVFAFPGREVFVIALGVVVGLLLWFLLSFFSIGVMRMVFKIGRGQELSAADLWGDLPTVLKMLAWIFVWMLLNQVIALACVAPSFIASLGLGSEIGGAILSLLGNVVAYVVQAYLSVVFWAAPFLIIDRGVGPIAALYQARDLSRGRRLMMFVIGLVAMLIAYAGLFAFCIGMMFTGAYAMIMAVVTYLTIMGEPTADQLQWTPRPQATPN